MAFLRRKKRLSLRRAARLVGISTSVLRYRKRPDANLALRRELRRRAFENRRDGCPQLFRDLRYAGWKVGKNRVERIYREENLALRRRKKKKLPAHLRGSVPAPEHPNDCWSIDFVSDSEVSGRHIRILALIDDATRESLLINARYSMTGEQVAEALDRVGTFRGYPKFLRADNGPEFRSTAMAKWATKQGVTLLFIEPGKPYQNCFIESFNARLRGKCLDLHVFQNLRHAQAVVDEFRYEYNHLKTHGSLGEPPAVFARRLRDKINNNPRTKGQSVAKSGG